VFFVLAADLDDAIPVDVVTAFRRMSVRVSGSGQASVFHAGNSARWPGFSSSVSRTAA
jgi:hypothetical protein